MTDSNTQPRAATPIDPVEGILEAFRTHELVAISEGTNHRDEQSHEFLRSLILDPRFVDIVDDIVVEFGNALYQDLMDRFVRGEQVSDKDLQQVWQNTTQPHAVLDVPVYAEFFRAVRSANTSLPKEKQLRVLLGDPPIDWHQIKCKEDYHEQQATIGTRDGFPAALIRREVLGKGRRALIIYGGVHLCRRNIFFNYEEVPVKWSLLMAQLEKTTSANVFTIWVGADLEKIQPDVASWRVPSMAILPGTVLGDSDFTAYYPYEITRNKIEDGKLIPIAREDWCSLRMEDQFDAVIYAGSSSSITYSQLSSEQCADAAYIKMRIERMAILQFSPTEIDEFKRHCEAMRPKRPFTGITVNEFLDTLRRKD